jgi:flagellar biosynthetic protein FliO
MRGIVGIMAAVLFSLAAVAPGPTAAQVASSQPASNVIHRSSGGGASSQSAYPQTSGWQVALSLAAVLGLIVALYWVSRRILPGGAFAAGSSSRAIQVLHRTALGPKHRVMLVQVGRRILVIAECAGQPLTTLCQITDPDEAAALIGQLGGDQRGAMAAFLEKAGSATPAPQSTESAELATTRQELDGLLQQVRTMAQQIGRA